ncbi:MAG: DUF4159 domain-containing protein [Rhizomicrobium sp.]|jgi:hypothetical protein
MNLLPGLSFGAPWVLAALIVLPAIWWLLRVTPPSPRRVAFPPLRLLLGLSAPQETPAHTPLWLMLLRLLAAALVIVALAQPSIGRLPAFSGNGPIILFVDNGWTSAHAWPAREAAMSDALAGAAHLDRPVMIVPTATVTAPAITWLDAGAAQRVVAALEPVAWLPDRARAVGLLAKTKFATPPNILWLSDGLDYGDARAIADALGKLGHLGILFDGSGKGPLALKPVRNEADGFGITVIRAAADGMRSGTILASGAHGESLATASFTFGPEAKEAGSKLTLPLEVRNETRRLDIVNEDSAGAVTLLDTGSSRRAVEIVAAGNSESEQPLLSGTFYLERALSPYADVHSGTIADGISRNVAVMVLADIGRIAGADYDRVKQFVSDGGVLLRFAGGRMTTNVDDLVPVKLRVGGRYLGGALTWSEPQHLAPFPEESPFRGLDIPADVSVSRQVLAEPSVELGSRTWARLDDGTPLVTGAQKDKGWVVLVHVTAGPAWSSLPLSGLYVDMLRRILALAGGARPADMATDKAAVWPPYATLDGFGRLQRPPGEALSIHASDAVKIAPSPLHPPGLYGHEGAQIALNTINESALLTPFAGLAATPYKGTSALALEAPLLGIAIVILLADSIVSLWLRGYVAIPKNILARIPVVVFALMLVHAPGARADGSFDEKAALDTRLAYVITGIPDVDAMSRAGLYGLGLNLKARTSYEPEDPMGVDIATDDLSFFPLLYWPMDPREKDLSPQAISKVADYMRNGGTILFDTRDLTLGSVRGAQSPGEQTLRRLTAKLDLPPLQPVPSDHVLTKSFYLLQDFPGRWDGGKVWVEALPPPDPDRGPEPARGGDDVSPVIIGGNDWAAAWATDDKGRPLADVTPGGYEQREMAIRFGINVVMYALTGNYKTDSVHTNALLERLGH